MGMGINNSSGSTPTTLAEINVTPLVDVMLVLLIVFMISAPLMQQGVQVNLPKAKAESLTEAPDQIILTVEKNHSIKLNGNSIPRGTLLEKLSAIAEAKPEIQVYIRADAELSYGYIAKVMAEVKKSKINRVGLVTEPGDSKTKI
jgi:biopolymer transport protein TolR